MSHHAQRHAKYERLLRRLRQRVFDYYDASESKGEHCSRLIARCKSICAPQWDAESRNRDRTNSQEFMFRTS